MDFSTKRPRNSVDVASWLLSTFLSFFCVAHDAKERQLWVSRLRHVVEILAPSRSKATVSTCDVGSSGIIFHLSSWYLSYSKLLYYLCKADMSVCNTVMCQHFFDNLSRLLCVGARVCVTLNWGGGYSWAVPFCSFLTACSHFTALHPMERLTLQAASHGQVCSVVRMTSKSCLLSLPNSP